nr:F-box protein At2g26850-like isoform X1 [Ipomoea batatas]
MGIWPLPLFWEEFSRFLVTWFRKDKNFLNGFLNFARILAPMTMETATVKLRPENVGFKEETTLLDLPDLALDCILERLSPAELCSVGRVCSSLREKCVSDHLWGKHMAQKWGKLIGNAACREWQSHIASRKRSVQLNSKNQTDIFGYFLSSANFLLSRPEAEENRFIKSSLYKDSIMALYFSLESGKFWFPAQVYNREVQNGQLGFTLSCYDAEVNYDSNADKFRARYLTQGWRSIEEDIERNRIRAPPVDTPSHVLHISDCLNDLKPDDHIEIQWRKNKEFPYGWWFGVVGHLESCSGSKLYCKCHTSDMVILEFRQYSPGSRWRQVAINRKDHQETGNEVDGFYGGIRKLYNEEEISAWKCFWPSCTLD